MKLVQNLADQFEARLAVDLENEVFSIISHFNGSSRPAQKSDNNFAKHSSAILSHLSPLCCWVRWIVKQEVTLPRIVASKVVLAPDSTVKAYFSTFNTFWNSQAIKTIQVLSEKAP